MKRMLGMAVLLACVGGLRAQVGVLDATKFPGGDIGAQVNQAFASCHGPCSVALPPRASYSQKTTIVVPGEAGQNLDCQSSGLLWQGVGDAIRVKGRNGDSPSGEIRNCTVAMSPGNRAAANGVRQESRIWFSYRNDTFLNWTNPGSAGLLIDNSRGADWPGYNERTHIRDVSFSNDLIGLRLVANDGGTNSFARSVIEIECNEHDGQTCFSGEQGADIYSVDEFSVHANLSSNSKPASLLTLSGGSGIRTGKGYIEAECAGSVPSYLYDIEDANAKFQLPGGVWNLGGCTSLNKAGNTANTIGSVDASGFTMQAMPYSLGLPQANNSKVIWNGSSWRYGIPTVGGYPSGTFQIFNRSTAGKPEVDDESETDAPELNVVACSGFNTHNGSPGGCGFGPGYGSGMREGGTLVPGYALETAGGLGIRDAKGRYAAAVSVDGMFTETLHTPASSSAPCTAGQFADDANFHYVCVAKDRWKRVALSEF